MNTEEQAKLEAEQKAKEEAEEKSKAEAEAQDDETTEDNESDEESKQLEAELKREREAREKAEKASADLAFKLREKKRKVEVQDEEEDVEDEDKPLTARQLQEVLAKEREATRKELQANEADRLASRLTDNETEKQLILEVYKNRSFPAHLSLEEQMEECYVIANKKRIMGENSELKRALKGKDGVSRDTTSHHDSPQTNQPKLAPEDNAEYARLGFKWNGTAKRFEKKLSNGKLLVKDLKTGGTRLE